MREVDLPFEESVGWLVRQIRAQVRRMPRQHEVSETVHAARDLYEANVVDLPADHLACRAGCGSCCRAHVGAEPAEGVAILRHLRDTLDPAALAALLGRVAAIAGQVADMDPGTRWEAGIFCAFLDGESQSCSIYPARPLACRGYTSTDLAACLSAASERNHDQDIPGDEERLMRAVLLRHALAEATARAIGDGPPPEHVEMHKAVREAAEAGDERSWLRRRRRSG